MDKKNVLKMVDHTLLTQTVTWEEIKELLDDARHYGTASACIPAAYVKQAVESFEDIEYISNQMADITKHLEEAVTIQKDSLSNMSKQIVQINDIAQQNLNASYESTTASQKLHKQAEDLQSISNRFRLRRFI